jgi:hypothetical protein
VLVDLPLAIAAVGAAAFALAREGFCFGALLPEYSALGDVLRLQPAFARSRAPLLETAAARALYAHAMRDRSGAA